MFDKQTLELFSNFTKAMEALTARIDQLEEQRDFNRLVPYHIIAEEYEVTLETLKRWRTEGVVRSYRRGQMILMSRKEFEEDIRTKGESAKPQSRLSKVG